MMNILKCRQLNQVSELRLRGDKMDAIIITAMICLTLIIICCRKK
jgi:hypothetical protein